MDCSINEVALAFEISCVFVSLCARSYTGFGVFSSMLLNYMQAPLYSTHKFLKQTSVPHMYAHSKTHLLSDTVCTVRIFYFLYFCVCADNINSMILFVIA